MRRTSPADSLAHWSKLLEGLSGSSQEFYSSVESGLGERKLPEATGDRVNYHEGGWLSPQREYLRIERGRHAIDICAAPYGSGFFVSWWLSRNRMSLFLALLFLSLLFAGCLLVSIGLFIALQTGASVSGIAQDIQRSPMFYLSGAWQSVPVFLMAVGAWFLVLLLLRHTRIGEALCDLPIIGPWWEQHFCPITYYRVDTYLMFLNSVHAAVLQVVDSLTTAQGVRALSDRERKPVMRDFFRR